MSNDSPESYNCLTKSAVFRVANALSAAIAVRGFALLAVDSSVVPKTLFDQLSQIDIPWENVVVLLKNYDLQSEHNLCPNAQFVRNQLLCNKAKSATFIPSQYVGISPSQLASIMSADVEPLLPIDMFVGNSHVAQAEHVIDGKLFSSNLERGNGTHKCMLSAAAIIGARASTRP